jgi:hypothetical protein
VGTELGHIGVLPLDAAADGPVEFQRWAGLQPLAKSCFVSFSPDSKIVFISIHRGPLILCHFDQLFQVHVADVTVIKADYESLAFACRHPHAPGLHFLRGRFDGVLVVLELTDSGICLSALPPPARPIPKPEGAIAFFALFAGESSVGVVGANGNVYEIAPGDGVRPHFEFESTPRAVCVPASFWHSAHLAKTNLLVTDESGNQVPLNRKLQLSRKRVVLTVRTTDTRVVVGVQIAFWGAGASHIKVNGHRLPIETAGERKVAIPLAREEVGRPVEIEVHAAGSDIGMQSIEIFVARPADLAALPVVERDWKLAAVRITDFVDTGSDPRGNAAECAAVAVSAAEITAATRGDAADIRSILRLMYERPAVATACRRMILKAAAEEKWLEAEWAHAIVEACQGGALADEMRELLWRDFALLPVPLKEEIAPVVWESAFAEKKGGLWCFVAGVVN